MTALLTRPEDRIAQRARTPLQSPRLGFLGVGWIGRHRLHAVQKSGLAEIVAVADASPEAIDSALALAPDAETGHSLDDLLRLDLDGIVIATPSAQHAAEAVRVLEAGRAAFVQKPLARTTAETRAIVNAARRADKLLAVDFSYRYIRGVSEIRELVQSGELGRVFAADLTFHNAYGPDKAWFYDARLSGGGCLIDLGSHLVDLALWIGGDATAEDVHGRLLREGEPLDPFSRSVEDYASAEWVTSGGMSVRLACSWRLSAGCDAVISATFYGTRGAVAVQNVNGSFYDFVVERHTGTCRERLAEAADDWGSGAILEWTRRLAADEGFDASADQLTDVAQLLDRMYGR